MLKFLNKIKLMLTLDKKIFIIISYINSILVAFKERRS